MEVALVCVAFSCLCLVGFLVAARRLVEQLRGKLAASALALHEEKQKRLRQGLLISDQQAQLARADAWRESVERADRDGAVRRAAEAALAASLRRRQTDAGAS